MLTGKSTSETGVAWVKEMGLHQWVGFPYQLNDTARLYVVIARRAVCQSINLVFNNTGTTRYSILSFSRWQYRQGRHNSRTLRLKRYTTDIWLPGQILKKWLMSREKKIKSPIGAIRWAPSLMCKFVIDVFGLRRFGVMAPFFTLLLFVFTTRRWQDESFRRWVTESTWQKDFGLCQYATFFGGLIHMLLYIAHHTSR